MSTSSGQIEGVESALVGRLEAEVSDLRRQLRHSQRLAAVGTMAAMVAHEFNNILTPMLNYAQMARNGDEALRDKALAHAYDGSQRACGICRALLDLTGLGPARPVPAVVAELVDQTLAAMARAIDKDGIRLVRKIPAELTVTTRAAEFKQVLLNLLLNARSAVLDKGRGQSISIGAWRTSGGVRVEVADTGVGIDPGDLERIFEPFFTTRRTDGGSGLGLPVCREIVESLGGHLSVRSQPGKGTKFTIELPDQDASQ